MVFVRTILASLTTLITQSSGQNGAHSTFADNNANGNGVNGPDNSNLFLETMNLSLEELDIIRTQEVTSKAASGLLVLLLKWFKISRMFESDSTQYNKL
jgi:hypothetical protein